MLDALRHEVPDTNDDADPIEWWARYSLSSPPGSPIQVGSRAEANSVRAAYHAPCADLGMTPKRLHVWRADINNEERDTPTGGWEYVAGRQHGATVTFERVDVENNIVLALYATNFVRYSQGWSLSSASDLIIPETGFYTFSADISVSGTANDLGRTFAEFIINDTARVGRNTVTNEDFFSLTKNRPLTKGDRFKMRVYHATGGRRAVTATVEIAMVNSPNYV